MTPLLEVKKLTISFKNSISNLEAVSDVNFTLLEGEFVGIVGESGSGKSVTAHSLLRILQTPPAIISNQSQIYYKGIDLMKKNEREMEKIRGKDIGMVFQDSLTALNPNLKIGTQLIEGVMKHEKISRNEAYIRAKKMLQKVGIADPEIRMGQYPFEFSGGMRQRISIAIALICSPKLLIADEPTTALDVTIQSQVLDLLNKLQKELSMTILLITHDLGIVARMCNRVIVMYKGMIVEEGLVEQIFYNPTHAYTKSLLNSIGSYAAFT